ncbi:hypothetical protein ACFTY8_39955 [Streptomyces mirabilis]|uniref:hypothetical protein n=1 Tax=Streptomyces mirabilis TaxID=68239 RepID=UPI003625DC8D
MSHLALAADGATLAACGRSSQILLWDPRPGRLLAELPDQPHAVHRLGLAQDGSWIAIGDVNSLGVLELPSNRERFTLKQTGARFATTEDAAGCPSAVTAGTRADGRATTVRGTGTGSRGAIGLGSSLSRRDHGMWRAEQ